ncbi:hypothetical protein, conserved [Trypanosoma brucei gambiense DAL972]|uniref:Uncharacterized protein n=1 Tax=Trypanosoma brucei gambiense (strain MHOM/CI/86/DAL972) TaxID=679716 RepID=C9ZY43_TRYB9|nr:hypothetical protein, conserved [Trypanosoma brucei gambiense DAL972]CBH14342.1 hypothetical protein, conserved [Trypanosoma brucei gambiense DAL972]|eukprot:XP_011776608.1 hypothetical protein, conserved [Trypanosoma brucei gambiense DAL972]
MAKSTRSKWKKAHRRQRAQLEAATVSKRIGRLNGKLKLAAEGGLSEVPLQDPETRFHFVNPQMDHNVPHTCKGLNNNYEQLIRESPDFNKPLKLKPPTTNYYGKSNPDAPHPVTCQYEVISATTPVAGHALSVEDIARMTKEQVEHNRSKPEEARNDKGMRTEENEENDMEEFVLGCNDAAKETTVKTKALLAGKTTISPLPKKSRKAPVKSVTTALKRNGQLRSSKEKKKVQWR